MKIDAFTPEPHEAPINAAFRMICTVMPQIVEFLGEAYQRTSDEREAAMLRIFRRNFTISTSAAQALIEKLEDRPAKLQMIAEQINAAITREELSETRKALGAMRVQDAMFDAEVDDLRAILATKLEQAEVAEREGVSYDQPEI